MDFPGGKPRPPPLPSLIKLGRAVTSRHVERLLAFLLRRGRHRLVGAVASQARGNSLPPTRRTHLLAASALLASYPLSRGASGGASLAWRLTSPSTYRAVVSELCGRGDVEGALKVFGVMTATGCQVGDRVCSVIISEFSKAGKAAAGLDFYGRVRREFSGFEPGLVTLTAVVNALGQERRIDEVVSLVRDMEQKGMVGDAVFHSSLVHGYIIDGQLMEGLRKHRLMLDKAIAADVVNYTTVIDGLCREGSVDKVMGFLDEMERTDAKPNLITYTSLVGGFCKRNRLEDAFSIVRKLERTGVVVDDYVYSILVDNLCKKGDLDRAFSFLEEMERNGIKPGIMMYNAVINGLCKAGDTNKAVQISKGVAADNFTYSTLLHGYIKGEDTSGVMTIKGRLERSRNIIDVVTCNILIKALFIIKREDDAFGLFHKMSSMGLSPNTVTYHTMVDMMCKFGEIDRALELFDEYKNGTSFSITDCTVVHSCLIKALCREGKVDMADQILYDLIQRNLRSDSCTCRMLVLAHYKEGGEHGVLNFIFKMNELEMNFFSSVCNYASAFLSTRDCCQAAMDVYKLLRMRSFSVTSKTCYKIFKSLLRNGNEQIIRPLLCEFIKIHGLHEPRVINMLSFHLSKKSAREAIRFSDYMDNSSIPSSVLRGIVYALKKEGEILDAYNLLNQAKQSGFSVDLAMYSIVVEGLCKGGYLEKALDLCASMKREGLHPNIIIHNSILSGLCQQGSLTEAFRLYDYLESSEVLPTIITYAILIGALCREGFLDDAYQLLQKMSNKGIRPTTRVYNLLISGYCNYGLTEKALELMSHFEELFLLPDAFTLGAIVSGHCLKGDTEAALGFFIEYHSIQMVPDFVGFMSLVKGLYAKGRMEESRGILREMFQCKEIVELINSIGDQIQAESLVGLLSSACEQGRIDEIVTILNEMRLMYVSSSDINSCNTLAHLNKLQRTGDECDPGTDSGQALSSITNDVSSNRLHGRYEGIGRPVIDLSDNLRSASDDTDIEFGNLLGKSFYDDFDTYYPAIASLCSKGELLKANKAIEAMLHNSG